MNGLEYTLGSPPNGHGRDGAILFDLRLICVVQGESQIEWDESPGIMDGADSSNGIQKGALG